MDKLGIQPVQLITQVINFLLMVVILTKFLYKPITKALEERKKHIAEGIEAAEKMKFDSEKSEKKRLEILAKARDEGREIIEESKKEGKRLEADIVEKAHNEALAIVEKGKQDVERERLDMEQTIKVQTVTLGKHIAQKLLEDALTVANQKTIIDKKINVLVRQLS